MKRKAVWVTVGGSMARLESTVRSTHRTWSGAQREASAARQDGEFREAVSAQVIAHMQAGLDYTQAVQKVAGTAIEAVEVEV